MFQAHFRRRYTINILERLPVSQGKTISSLLGIQLHLYLLNQTFELPQQLLEETFSLRLFLQNDNHHVFGTPQRFRFQVYYHVLKVTFLPCFFVIILATHLNGKQQSIRQLSHLLNAHGTFYHIVTSVHNHMLLSIQQFSM